MDKTVVNPFDEITLQEVYDGIKSQGCIQRIYEDIRTQVKNTNSYKSLMKMAEQNILGSNFNIPLDDVQSKKKKIHEIGLLASQYDVSITNVIAKTIEYEAKFAVEVFIKRHSSLKQIKATEISSPTNKGIKRSANNSSEKLKVGKYCRDHFEIHRNRLDDSDDESDSSESVSSSDVVGSSGSVSSVHTSELSSFEDEVVIPTEEKKNENNPKILSFKAVNQAYKSMVSKKKKTSKQIRSIQKTSKTIFPKMESSGDSETDSHKPLPKRKPKPNSRYSSMAN